MTPGLAGARFGSGTTGKLGRAWHWWMGGAWVHCMVGSDLVGATLMGGVVLLFDDFQSMLLQDLDIFNRNP